MISLRRAFLAVVPPPAVRAWAESAQNSAAAIAPDLRWTRTEQRHLTLRFFGAVDDPIGVAEFVAVSVRQRAPFTLALGGGGAFPDPQRASVLWLGVQQGSEALGALAASIADPEERPFRGHLTLARSNTPRDLRQVIDVLDACGESESWTVDEIVLFDSNRGTDGVVHTEQARFTLGTAS